MFLSIYFGIVIFLAVVYYVYMIIHDVFLVKEPADMQQKPEDEDIDISDEAGQFQPILIEKEEDPPPKKTRKKARSKKSTSKESTENKDDQSDKSEDSNKQDTESQQPPVIGSDDQPTNRKPLDDIASQPPVMNKEKREHIDSLVDKVRKQMSEEESQEKISDNKSDENIQKAQTDDEEKVESEDVIIDGQPLEDNSNSPKGTLIEELEAKEKAREEPVHELAIFEMRCYIDDEAEPTEHCDGQTAEETQTEAEKISKDPEAFSLKALESDWVMLDNAERQAEVEQALAEQQKNGGEPKELATFSNLE